MPAPQAPIKAPLFSGKAESIVSHPAWIEWFLKFLSPAYLPVIKSGATQVAAGAAPGEVWKTKTHATLPDNVLMIGV